MINSLLTFGAKSVNPEILEKTLTVRKSTVDEIEKNCINKTINNSTFQSLLIAPRGSGKTHIIKVLYHRLKQNIEIDGKFVIAYMSEDEIGIANFTDLIVSVLRSFTRYSEVGSETLEAQISEASSISDTNKREIFIKNILNDFANKRIIILLVENFDRILDSIGSSGQGSLRDFIHQYNNLSIIATSQSLITYLQDSKNPFYNFFNVSQLKKLDFEDTRNFLIAIAQSEGNLSLEKEISKSTSEGKLRAIYELTGGNHRLLVTFYSFLNTEFKHELSSVFVKVMNDLKPYYEQFINNLPAQQQKIVKYLSLNRRAVRGKEIARACFIEPNVTSKQLSLLFEKGMIDKNKLGKDVFYELKEPLMRICFEISENPNGISKLFVDFLSTYYDKKIIKELYLKYKYGGKFQSEQIRHKYKNEAHMYSLALSEADHKEILLDIEKKEKQELESNNQNVDLIAKEQLQSYSENQNTELANKEQVELYGGLIKKGNSFVKKENYEKAIVCFEKAIKLFPQKDDAYLLLGSAYGSLGQFKNAIDSFNSAIIIDSNNVVALTGLGITYSYMKSYKEALESYEKVIEISPNNYFVYHNMGVIYGYLKEYDKVIYYSQKAIEINPEYYKSYHNMGIAFISLNKFEKAINSFQKAVSLNSKDEEAYLGLGLVLQGSKQYEKAIENYYKVLELNPNSGTAYFGLGVAYSYVDQYEKSRDNCIKAIKIDPENDGAYLSLGYAYRALKQYNESIKNLYKAIEINTNNYGAYLSLGVTYRIQNQFNESIEILEKVIEINPNIEDAYLELGVTYNRMTQYNNALFNFQKIIDLNPNRYDAYQYLGDAYQRLTQYESAIKSYEKAFELNSESDNTILELGNTYFNLKKYEMAICNYKKVIEINSSNNFVYLNLGTTYESLKQYENAIEIYKKGIAINPKNDFLYNNLGLVYLKIDAIDEAIKIFIIGLRINPNNQYIRFSLLGAYIRINDIIKSKKLLKALSTIVKKDLFIFSFAEDVYYNLFKFGGEIFIESYLDSIESIMINAGNENPMWKALPDSLFSILRSIDDYSSERLSWIEEKLSKYIDANREIVIPMKIFQIGIAYLKNSDKNSIYLLSKEERKVFKEEVLNQIE